MRVGIGRAARVLNAGRGQVGRPRVRDQDDVRALILDRLVAGWLVERTPLTLTASRFVKRDYASYLDAMTNWADKLDIEAHQVEELIFSDEARRRGLPGWGSPFPREFTIVVHHLRLLARVPDGDPVTDAHDKVGKFIGESPKVVVPPTRERLAEMRADRRELWKAHTAFIEACRVLIGSQFPARP